MQISQDFNLPLHNANFGIFIACMVPEIFAFLGTDTARPDFEITTFKYLKGKIRQKKATFEADSLYEIYDVKRKKEVTSETAYGTSQQKRRYIFCRKSYFTAKHKILKRQN